MKSRSSPGQRFLQALRRERPLQVAGTINAFAARLAQEAGFRALYLSGAGVANASYGISDIGLTTLENVLEDLRRITSVTDLPVLVDADTGWAVRRTVREISKAGAAGLHIEDQVAAKRCGHLPRKSVVRTSQMVKRIKAAVDARHDRSFVIIARTDAVSVEGLEAAIERALAYKEAGANMIFPEALTRLEHYRKFAKAVGVPILANMTEFGVSPLFTARQLAGAGVRIILYPLSAFRAMNAAALKVYHTIRKRGTQKSVLRSMQTRKQLYKILKYKPF